MAAGIMSTKAIQLQFLLNQPTFSVRLRSKTRMIESSPQGMVKNFEVLMFAVAMVLVFEIRKVENIDEIKNL